MSNRKNLEDIFLRAVKGDDVTTVQDVFGEQLKFEDSVNDGEILFLTPLLCYAAHYGALNILRLLLNVKVDPNSANRNGWSALHNAAQSGHVECVRELLKHGADVNMKDRGAITPLLAAAKGGNLETLQLLLESGANVNFKSVGSVTVLHEAAQMGHSECLEELLKKGANTETTSKNGRTALHFAARFNQSKCVEILLKYGANINAVDKYNETPLHDAAWNGHEEVVDALLQNTNIDVTMVNNSKQTALDVAERERHNNVVASITRYIQQLTSQESPHEGEKIAKCHLQFYKTPLIPFLLHL